MRRKRKQWTLDELVTLESLCKEGMASFAVMGLILGRTADSVCIQAGRSGLKNRFHLLKYTKNEEFWAVPNPINSYYAGLLAADGSVNWDKNLVSIALNATDAPEIEEFVRVSEYTGPIHRYAQPKSSLFVRGPIAQLQINNSKRWNDDLYRNFNLFPQKTYRMAPPNLHSDLLKACYILGYLDGDGSICFTGTSTSVGVSSASREILEWMKQFIDAHFHPEKGSRYANVLKLSDSECWNYSITGNRAVHIFDFFRSLPTPKFARKWEDPTILGNVARHKALRPHVFSQDSILSFDSTGTLVRHSASPTPPPADLEVPLVIGTPAQPSSQDAAAIPFPASTPLPLAA